MVLLRSTTAIVGVAIDLKRTTDAQILVQVPGPKGLSMLAMQVPKNRGTYLTYAQGTT